MQIIKSASNGQGIHRIDLLQPCNQIILLLEVPEGTSQEIHVYLLEQFVKDHTVLMTIRMQQSHVDTL